MKTFPLSLFKTVLKILQNKSNIDVSLKPKLGLKLNFKTLDSPTKTIAIVDKRNSYWQQFRGLFLTRTV